MAAGSPRTRALSGSGPAMERSGGFARRGGWEGGTPSVHDSGWEEDHVGPTPERPTVGRRAEHKQMKGPSRWRRPTHFPAGDRRGAVRPWLWAWLGGSVLGV